MMKTMWIMICFCVLACIGSGHGALGQTAPAAGTFTMAFSDSPDHSPVLKFAELVYTEAFRRLGLQFAYAVYPLERCGAMANAGEVDGEPARRRAYNQDFPNLIRVEEVFMDFVLSAFAVDPSIRLDGWESLQGTAYRVETIIGSHTTEEHILRVVAPERFSKVATVKQALKKLQAHRTDILIHAEVGVLQALRAEEFRDAGIVEVGVMEDLSVYPFLHTTHADLAPKLAEVLKHMKAEGLVAEYWAQTMPAAQP